MGDAFALRGAAEDGGIEGIVGLIDAHLDAELAAGALVNPACNADWAMEKQAMVGAENAQCTLGECDLNVGSCWLDAEGWHVGDADAVAGSQLMPADAGVEVSDEVGVALGLLGNHFH